MRTSVERGDIQEIFRDHVLKALDAAAREVFDPPRNDAGATDADLPRLFKAIDAQIETLAERYDVAILDTIAPRF